MRGQFVTPEALRSLIAGAETLDVSGSKPLDSARNAPVRARAMTRRVRGMSAAHKITARPNISAGWVCAFRAPSVAGGAAGTSGSESGDQVTVEVTAQVTAEVTAQVAAFCREPQPAKAIMAELGLKHWKTFQANYLVPLMDMGILERTIPGKPRSRMQRYRTTEAGLAASKERRRES